MKPDFALSLSFDGIRLLARAAGGWRLAGEVSLDDPDLSAALAALRERAVDLGGPAFRTKLLIPNDQIRYLSVDTGHVSTTDRIEQVRRALDGATPYAVEELVYDICVDGTQTHVAAVARDTLDEAEAFAMEHRFSPVSWVAIPGDEAFLGEPFFGPTAYSRTALASGERVEPDGIAVVVIGSVEAAVPPPLDTPPEPSGPASERATDAQHQSAPVQTLPAAPPPDLPVDAHPAGPTSQEPVVETSPQESDPTDDGAAEPDVDPIPSVPGFSSRRTAPQPPVSAPLGGATRTAAPSSQINAPRIEAGEDETHSPPIPRVPAPSATTPDPAALAASLEPELDALPDRAASEDADPIDDLPPIESTWAARFLSKRATSPALARPKPAAETIPTSAPPRPMVTASPRLAQAGPGTADPDDERSRMTIFGQREPPNVRGAPRHLGLILTAVLLLFLAGVAAWASMFLEDGLAGLFDREEPVQAAQVPQQIRPEVSEPPTPAEQTVSIGPGQTGLTETDAAVLDALRDTPEPPAALDLDTVEARYAVTGIWQRAPVPPSEPRMVTLDDLYLTSIDRRVDAQDALALPTLASFATDRPLGQIISPAAPGSEFAFDESGRVIPTASGALSPDGFTVFLGRPPLVPPPTPTRFTVTPEADTLTSALIGLRPRLRPDNLVERSERTQLGGLTRNELADVRPRLRPDTELVEEEESVADETATSQAVLASLAPRVRPSTIARIVEEADTGTAEAPTQVATAATVTPRIPSSASVARAATVNNAINLRKVNLIGVYGTPSNRRALVRLPNGRYKKVQVGDRLDGGRISAIGDSELRYQKSGRNLTLKIPSG